MKTTKQNKRNMLKKQVRSAIARTESKFISIALHRTPTIIKALSKISKNAGTRKEAVENAIILASGL